MADEYSQNVEPVDDSQTQQDPYQYEPEEGNSGTGKTALIIMIVLVVVLAIILAYIWASKAKLVKDLNIDKETLTEQVIALQNDYADLSSDYEAINMQLDSSREEVAQLIERIKKTEATNRAKIREYEKELGTLRTVMRSYIVQIDSLNTLNQRLKAEAADARREAAQSKKEIAKLNSTVETLAGQVATGKALKAYGLTIEGHNSSDKVTDRSSRIVYMTIMLTLAENDLADRGPVTVYVRVTDPDGQLLTNSRSTQFKSAGQTLMSSAQREVDYQGEDVDLTIYLNDIEDYTKGTYTVEAFVSTGSLGSTDVTLK